MKNYVLFICCLLLGHNKTFAVKTDSKPSRIVIHGNMISFYESYVEDSSLDCENITQNQKCTVFPIGKETRTTFKITNDALPFTKSITDEQWWAIKNGKQLKLNESKTDVTYSSNLFYCMRDVNYSLVLLNRKTGEIYLEEKTDPINILNTGTLVFFFLLLYFLIKSLRIVFEKEYDMFGTIWGIIGVIILFIILFNHGSAGKLFASNFPFQLGFCFASLAVFIISRFIIGSIESEKNMRIFEIVELIIFSGLTFILLGIKFIILYELPVSIIVLSVYLVRNWKKIKAKVILSKI